MARPRRDVIGVRMHETFGSDRAGVARALYSWAAMLADAATGAAMDLERQTASQKKLPPTSP